MRDDDAFERFVREHTATLHRTAFLLTGNRYLAEELLQETLSRLYPKWQQVMDADAALAYVRRSLVNRFVSGSPLAGRARRIDVGTSRRGGTAGTSARPSPPPTRSGNCSATCRHASARLSSCATSTT